jgi:hypothetical protein
MVSATDSGVQTSSSYTATGPTVWRATAAHRCPICGGNHACSRTADGLYRCRRQRGDVLGWRYVGETHSGTWGLYRPDGDAGDYGGAADRHAAHVRIVPPAESQVESARRDQQESAARPRRGRQDEIHDWNALAQQFQDNADARRRDWTLGTGLEAMAGYLGVTEYALRSLGAGVVPGGVIYKVNALRCSREPPDALAIPERDETGNVVGISTRDPASGDKGFLKGGHRGLVYHPDDVSADDVKLVVEGASDVFAGRAMRLNVFGRASNMTGSGLLARLFKGLPGDVPVIVLIENDQKEDGTWPGRDGALRTATALATALGRPVWVAPVPDGTKDLRRWFNSYHPDLYDEGRLEELGGWFVERVMQAAELVPAVGGAAPAPADQPAGDEAGDELGEPHEPYYCMHPRSVILEKDDKPGRHQICWVRCKCWRCLGCAALHRHKWLEHGGAKFRAAASGAQALAQAGASAEAAAELAREAVKRVVEAHGLSCAEMDELVQAAKLAEEEADWAAEARDRLAEALESPHTDREGLALLAAANRSIWLWQGPRNARGRLTRRIRRAAGSYLAVKIINDRLVVFTTAKLPGALEFPPDRVEAAVARLKATLEEVDTSARQPVRASDDWKLPKEEKEEHRWTRVGQVYMSPKSARRVVTCEFGLKIDRERGPAGNVLYRLYFKVPAGWPRYLELLDALATRPLSELCEEQGGASANNSDASPPNPANRRPRDPALEFALDLSG